MTEPSETEQPATPTESALCDIWSNVLGTSVRSRHADFFSCGGDSFLATKAVILIRREWSVDIPVDALFENRTLKDLAARIDEICVDNCEAS
ncbi:phosphopantetheine-binding protein [Kitasatospora aureofaciens]|uniref:phosphopantetheine-binding protein n=1 Tax=Kitasatospora aureofaciens TaxID=1894 RepID=UPI0037CAA930